MNWICSTLKTARTSGMSSRVCVFGCAARLHVDNGRLAFCALTFIFCLLLWTKAKQMNKFVCCVWVGVRSCLAVSAEVCAFFLPMLGIDICTLVAQSWNRFASTLAEHNRPDRIFLRKREERDRRGSEGVRERGESLPVSANITSTPQNFITAH